MANKIKYGIKNAYYAKKDAQGEFTTPVALPGAVSISLTPQGEFYKFYADNIEYFRTAVNNGYEGELVLALVPESFYTDILGDTLTTGDQVLMEKADALSNEFALGVQFEGDEKATRYWFYNCVATRPEINGETKEDGIEVQTETLSISIAPNADGIVRAKTTASTTATAYDNWFTQVFTPTQEG